MQKANMYGKTIFPQRFLEPLHIFHRVHKLPTNITSLILNYAKKHYSGQDYCELAPNISLYGCYGLGFKICPVTANMRRFTGRAFITTDNLYLYQSSSNKSAYLFQYVTRGVFEGVLGGFNPPGSLKSHPVGYN